MSSDKKKFQIKDVACGCYHTLALSLQNNVYAFGRNSHGQLGNNTTKNAAEPIEIDLHIDSEYLSSDDEDSFDREYYGHLLEVQNQLDDQKKEKAKKREESGRKQKQSIEKRG